MDDKKNGKLYEAMIKVCSSPPKPVKPNEEKLNSNIIFPDKDATSEEIQEILEN